MNGFTKTYSPQEWILSGLLLLALGVFYMTFSKKADKTGGIGKGRITGDQAQRARSGSYLVMIMGLVLIILGICGMFGLFQG